jgi:DNA-binding CsgD family transcriptional regulator
MWQQPDLSAPQNSTLGGVGLNAVETLMVTLGEANFFESLIAILKSVANFDGAVAYVVRGEESHADAVRLWAYGIRPEHKLVSAHVALGRRAFARGLVSRSELRSLVAPSSEYASVCALCSLCDDFVSFSTQVDNASRLIVSIWRAQGAGPFSISNIAGYRALEPIVRASAVKHIRLLAADGNIPRENDRDRRLVSHQGESLTQREQQIVHMVFDGHCNESIAHALDIAWGTVKIHKKNIYRKLRISSESDLLRMVIGDIAGRSSRQTRENKSMPTLPLALSACVSQG